MARKLSIMDSGWLMMETRETPMHVGGLALFAIPEDAPSDYMESVYRFMVEVDGVCRPFSQKIQSRLPGRLDAAWVEDKNFDIDYHAAQSHRRRIDALWSRIRLGSSSKATSSLSSRTRR